MVLRATERHKRRPVRSLLSHWSAGEPIAATPTPACLLTAREIKLLYLLRSNQAVAGCPVGGCGAPLTLCLLTTRAWSRAAPSTDVLIFMYARFGDWGDERLEPRGNIRCLFIKRTCHYTDEIINYLITYVWINDQVCWIGSVKKKNKLDFQQPKTVHKGFRPVSKKGPASNQTSRLLLNFGNG